MVTSSPDNHTFFARNVNQYNEFRNKQIEIKNSFLPQFLVDLLPVTSLL